MNRKVPASGRQRRTDVSDTLDDSTAILQSCFAQSSAENLSCLVRYVVEPVVQARKGELSNGELIEPSIWVHGNRTFIRYGFAGEAFDSAARGHMRGMLSADHLTGHHAAAHAQAYGMDARVRLTAQHAKRREVFEDVTTQTLRTLGVHFSIDQEKGVLSIKSAQLNDRLKEFLERNRAAHNGNGADGHVNEHIVDHRNGCFLARERRSTPESLLTERHPNRHKNEWGPLAAASDEPWSRGR